MGKFCPVYSGSHWRDNGLVESRLPKLKDLPPEWEALIVAAREIELENAHERQRNEKLQAENSVLRHKIKNLEAMISSNRHVSEATRRFKAIVAGLLRDYEHLSKTHPLHDLLEAKEAELQRLKKGLQLIPLQHPDRKTAESMLRAHIRERDQLQSLLITAQGRIEQAVGAAQSASKESAARALGGVGIDPVSDNGRRD